jgi:uracil-DNA glycosylase
MYMKNLIKELIESDIKDNGIDLLSDLKLNICEQKKISKCENLNFLKDAFRNCDNCSLFHNRKNVVFGMGNLDSKIVFISEAPWNEDDETGKVFSGEKGELFNKILSSIGLDRSSIYITDIVKCIPFDNYKERRTPIKEEIDSCLRILKKEIEIINPKVICTLGNTSTQYLLRTEEDFMSLHGNLYDNIFFSDKLKSIKIFPLFHPAFLIRKPEMKKYAWEDLKKLKDILEKI